MHFEKCRFRPLPPPPPPPPAAARTSRATARSDFFRSTKACSTFARTRNDSRAARARPFDRFCKIASRRAALAHGGRLTWRRGTLCAVYSPCRRDSRRRCGRVLGRSHRPVRRGPSKIQGVSRDPAGSLGSVCGGRRAAFPSDQTPPGQADGWIATDGRGRRGAGQSQSGEQRTGLRISLNASRFRREGIHATTTR